MRTNLLAVSPAILPFLGVMSKDMISTPRRETRENNLLGDTRTDVVPENNPPGRAQRKADAHSRGVGY